MEKKYKLSPEQDRAANPLENVWVQANAGTGKTSVLVQRLLRILFRTPNCTSSGILCLTYTNAGAGEMRVRILKALRNWASLPDEKLIEALSGITEQPIATPKDVAHAREIFFQYIDNPEMLKVKTIHSFCEEILRRFPIEAGLPPTWSLVSDAAQRVLLQDTFTKLINSPSNKSRVYAAFEHIVGRISEKSLDDLLEVLSDQYKLFFQINDIDKYREYFIETTANFLDINNTVKYDFNVEKLQEIVLLAESGLVNAKKSEQPPQEIITLTKQFIDNTIDFEEYKSAYLTDKGTPRVKVSKIPYLIEEQEHVYTADQYNMNLQAFQDSLALFDLAAAFAVEYRDLKRARNLLDFEDMILYTRRLFSSPENMGWVLSQLDLSLSHILLDEAQDTSPMQWDIMRMLSGDFFTDGDTDALPHSLFVVGDTKQSIYGFQGADPNAFALSREAIGQTIQQNLRTLAEIPLAQSFRSTRPVLASVDKFFSDDEVISVSNFSNNAHKCFRKDEPGVVEIHKLCAKLESGRDLNDYIQQIADKICELISSGVCTPAEIMVLVQKRDPMASPLVAELKRRNIEVAGSDRIKLPNFAPIRDLLNLVRWCLDHSDDFSLCCVLKSPIFYLKEVDIFNLCKTRNMLNDATKNDASDIPKTTIFQILETAYPEIYSRLNTISEWGQTLAPYSFFSNVLNTNKTRQQFISALGEQVIDPLEEFMTICLSYERTQPGTIKHFLRWFITGSSEIKRDMDASRGVRVVTVHSSKGLESKAVFLIDTVRMPKNENILPLEKILPFASDDRPVWLWLPRSNNSAICAHASKSVARTKMAEYFRLLYVAMTRAMDMLYIYGYTKNKNTTPNCWHDHLWRVFADNQDIEYIRITNENCD